MFSDSVLFYDIETHGVEHRWNMPPDQFFRIAGYAWGEHGDVQYTTSRNELLDLVRSAKVAVAHNQHAFDLSVSFGVDSIEPLELALDNRIFDTWTYATLHYPSPPVFTARDGRRRKSTKPEEMKSWFSLDNLAYQLGVPGKLMDLSVLAKKHGGYGLIPLDDPEYLSYLQQDVLALRDVARELIKLGQGISDYDWREQKNAAIDAQNCRNGWRVDVNAARQRFEELEQIKNTNLARLNAEFGLPTEGKKPLATKKGKEAITLALASVGISLDELPRTKINGVDTDRPSFGGKGLVEVASDKSPEAQELASSIAQIAGLRPLAQQTLDCLQDDGKVHVDITTLQRSGRKSTTKPGLTTWTARGVGAIEKIYYLPDNDSHLLVEFDYSQADARIVAALSGDPEFAKRFQEGVDAHMLTAEIVWGVDVVAEDRKGYRQIAKGMNHAYGYRAGAKKLAAMAKQPLAVAYKFVDAMKKAYSRVTKWQDKVTKEGDKGYVTNDWGRVMPVDKQRSFTQSPALHGQSGTRELIVDSLIRMCNVDLNIIRMLKAQVHDALIFSIPKDRLEHYVKIIRECMEVEWEPSDGTGQLIDFPVGYAVGQNWYEASH